MAEGKVLLDPIYIGFVNHNRATQTTAAFGALALAEVAAPGLIAQDLAASRDLKSLGHRFFRFDTFRASHKFWFFSKERAV